MARRGRVKSRKDYTIKLVHPEMGEFYFHYYNRDYTRYNYYFTQNLNKVKVWKTSKFVESQIKDIFDKLDDKKGKVFLEFGEEPNEEMKSKLTISRKKYYFTINSIMSKIHIDNAKNNISELNETLVNDSKLITKLIRKNKHIEKDFMKIINKLTNDINMYRKDYNFLEKSKDSEPVFIDIVDASYGFRLLKLKTLKKVQIENEIQS